MADPSEESMLDRLDKLAPSSLNSFDAFPKVHSTYKARSGSRGFLTLFVAILSFVLILNDLGEWVWGWTEWDFNVDAQKMSFMRVNVDLVVNMPCQYLSVDLRDALGDRLYLSDGFKRDGTLFDIGQARTLQAHQDALSAKQAVSQSRKSQGFFSIFGRSKEPQFRPTYNHKSDGSACRIYGSMVVKKVTANLHITTLGHGYASSQHVPHNLMNLSHVINDMSFGPYFPEMTQPLEHSLEITEEPFIAYSYFLHIVPTKYIVPGMTLFSNQYSVTHYTRTLEHDKGTPGIFFKLEMEPVSMTVRQKYTTFVQFLIRVVGVVGGVWCCMGWAIKVGEKAVDVATGSDKAAGIVAAEASGVKKKWGGGELRSRVTRQGSGWTVDASSPYGSYTNTPVISSFAPSPTMSTYSAGGGSAAGYANGGTANGGAGYGLGLQPGSPAIGGHHRTGSMGGPPTPSIPTAATAGSPYATHSSFPTPNPLYSPVTHTNSFPPSPAPGSPAFSASQQIAPPRKDVGKKAD